MIVIKLHEQRMPEVISKIGFVRDHIIHLPRATFQRRYLSWKGKVLRHTPSNTNNTELNTAWGFFNFIIRHGRNRLLNFRHIAFAGFRVIRKDLTLVQAHAGHRLGPDRWNHSEASRYFKLPFSHSLSCTYWHLSYLVSSRVHPRFLKAILGKRTKPMKYGGVKTLVSPKFE